MTLYDSLPEYVTAGRKYRLDLDFRNVLRMLDILADETLLEESRMYLALRCVMRHVPGRMSKQIKLFAAVTGLLFGDAKHGEQHETYMSLTQDAELIIGAFRQAYGINLYTDRLHWFEFRTLLACLPEGSRYSEVVDIRAKPLPKPTKWNGEERMSLLRAKHSVALQRTDRQTRESYTASVYRVADSLKAIAKRGEGH